MRNSVKGSLALAVSRVTAGLNINVTKFLIPLWIAPLQMVTLRLLFGTLFFWVLAIFDKPDLSTRADRVKLVLLGAFAVFGYMSLAAFGISFTTPVNFAIFNATQPMWVFLFSVLWRSEKVSFVKVAGIAVGFAGVVATLFAEPDAGLARHPALGNLFALTAAVVYAVYLLTSSSLLARVPNLVMLRYTFLGATVPAVLLSLFTGFDAPLFAHPDASALSAVAFVLLFPTAISYILIPIGLKYLKTTLVAMYGYLSLAVAAVASLLVGQDKLDAMLAVALLLICAGIYMVNFAERGSRRNVK